MEGARTEESRKGARKNDGTRVRSFAVAYILLIGLAIIVFVYLGPHMLGTGMWLFPVVALVLILGATGGAVRLVSRTGEKDSGKGVPRGAVKLLVIGLVVVSMGFAIFFGGIAFLPYEERSAELFFLFVGLIIVGMGIALAGRISAEITYSARRFKVPESLLNSVQQIGPDKSFETKKFHVFRKNGIYILLQKRLWGVHFINLLKQTPVSDRKVKAPYLGPWAVFARSFKDEVNGLRLAKIRREFTMPVGIVKLGDRTEAKYVSGPGILYYVSLYPVGRLSVNHYGKNLYDKLDAPTIIKILSKLSEETAAEA